MEKWNYYYFSLPEEFKALFKKACKLEKLMINYLENSSEEDELNFQTLINFITENNIQNNIHTLSSSIHFISFLTKRIFINNDQYFEKIKKFLLFFKQEITLNVPTERLYNCFHHNNQLLLFLYQNEFLDIFNSKIIDKIFTRNDIDNIFFFYPEIKKRVLDADDKEKNKEVYSNLFDIISKSPYYFNRILNDDSFEKDRKSGVNNGRLAEIIRKDSFEEFIEYKEKTDMNLNSSVHNSILDGNVKLSKSHPSLIEYSAFFGSIKIFKYLYKNKVELSPFLWICAIYGRNYEIIHLLENKILQTNFDRCLQVSVKLHLNDFANYFLDNQLDGVLSDQSFEKCISSFNFQFIKQNSNIIENNEIDDLDDFQFFIEDLFRMCCINGYYYFAAALLSITQPVQIDINMKMDIQKNNFFFLIVFWHFF